MREAISEECVGRTRGSNENGSNSEGRARAASLDDESEGREEGRLGGVGAGGREGEVEGGVVF